MKELLCLDKMKADQVGVDLHGSVNASYFDMLRNKAPLLNNACLSGIHRVGSDTKHVLFNKMCRTSQVRI